MRESILSNGELSGFCMELALLLHAGVGEGEGLYLMAEETRDSAEQAFLTDMARRMDDGEPLARVLADTGRFPGYMTGLVEVGERSGRTEEALRSLARYYDGRDRLERQLRSALLYPAVLLLMMLVVIVVLLVRVLPVFDDVYASLGGRLTGLAGGLLVLGRTLDRGMPVLCVLLVLAVGLLAAFAAGGAFRERVLAFWRRHMGDRGVFRSLHTARFAQAMAMGLGSGLPVEEAVELAASLHREAPAAQRRYDECLAALERGESLAQALSRSGALPAASCRMLQLGLRGGNGDVVMEEIARRLSQQAEDELQARVGYVEPTLVILTSALVGVILLSVMLPLMHIMSAIG